MKNTVHDYEEIVKACEETEIFYSLILEEGETREHDKELEHMLRQLGVKIETLEIHFLLSGKYDSENCIFSLNAGAGGTDAQDWAQLLLRMYIRWFDKKEFQYEIVDQMYGDEAGIKSVTLLVKGLYAYGFLKNEVGVHRLVRLSPFNANNKRQTSFAAADAIPELKPDTDLFIDPRDLRIDTFRSSGAGGQHVNRTDSAVRITHIPSGLVAQSQNNRSQISNRETAMTILKSRLFQAMELEHKKKLEEIRGDVKNISWGNQIRSYVFHPYKLVKDLRTDLENTNVTEVMNGDLDAFINANLREQFKRSQEKKND